MTHFEADELDRLAYAMASGTLDAEELAWVNSEGNSNPDFVAKVEYWQAHLSGLDHAALQAEPSDSVWQGIEANLPNTQAKAKAQTQDQAHPATKPNRPWWQAMAMAASLAFVALLIVWQQPSITQVNLDNQWSVQMSSDQGELLIVANNPMPVPAGKVCNLWFKTGDTVIGIAQLPLEGQLKLNLQKVPELKALLDQKGTMMVTMDAADAGLEVMYNQALINGQWL